METIKSPKFVLAAMAIVSLSVLAGLSLIEGNTAAAGILGLAGGTMVGKIGVK